MRKMLSVLLAMLMLGGVFAAGASAASFKLTYNANGGTGAPPLITVANNAPFALSTQVPVREGYTFLGWSDSNANFTPKYQPGDLYTPYPSSYDSSGTLYAVWVANTYTLTYNANGGTGAPPQTVVGRNVIFNLSTQVPVRGGYLFHGWSTGKTAMDGYKPGTALFITDNSETYLGTERIINRTTNQVQLYAIWEKWPPDAVNAPQLGANLPVRIPEANTEYSYYDIRNYVKFTPSTSGVYRVSLAVTELMIHGNPPRPYTGCGPSCYLLDSSGNVLATKTTGATTETTLTTTFNLTAGQLYYFRIGFAAWPSYYGTISFQLDFEGGTPEPTTYTLTYNANGGTGAPPPLTVPANEYFNLSSIVPTRVGYIFKGWATSATAKSAQFQPGDEDVYLTGNVTIYAVWNATCTLTYDANGGTGAPPPVTVPTNEDFKLSSTVPTRSGYQFCGWNTSKGATSFPLNGYQPNETFMPKSDTTLYAVWRAWPPAATAITPGRFDVIFAIANLTKVYSFTPSVSGEYRINTSPIPSSGTGSYDIYCRLFDSSGEVVAFQYGTYGYGFLKYNLTAGQTYYYEFWLKSGTLADYTIVLAKEDAPNPDPTTYTLTYDANGGTGAPANQTKTQGTALTLRSTQPTRSGYTFKGWATSATAATAQYQPGGQFTTDANTTLYAVWEADANTPTTYTLTYDANGGTGAPPPQTVPANENTLTLSSTVPTRAGYIFKGWANSSSATAAEFAPGTLITLNFSGSIYAVWEANANPNPNPDPNPKWWEGLPGILQTILRIVFFGWLWMN